MASYPPPPYSPPPGSFGFDPRQQKQFLREQAKAYRRQARDAERSLLRSAAAERSLRRQQMRAMRRRSILGPLLLLVVGMVALLIRLGTIPFSNFMYLYGRWWPGLLVVAGLILLLEWAFDQRIGSDGVAVGHRSVGGGGVFLLILLALTGAVFHGIHDGRNVLIHEFSINPENVEEFLGDKHELNQVIDQPFLAGTGLSIDNPHGDVTIMGQSDDNKIHIVVNKQIYSHSDADAEAKGRQLSPQVGLSGSTLSVVLPALSGATSDLSITVPDFAQTNVNATHGDVRISALHSAVNITANRGEVKLNSIVGSVTAHVNHSGSSFAAHGVSGDVSLKGHAEDLNIADVSGQVVLEGDFYGDTHIEHVRGPVNFDTSRTHFTLLRLDGAIDISPDSELTATQIAGPVVLRTRSRNISIDGLLGTADVTNSNGTVDITAPAPLGNVTVDNRSGAVHVTVPDHAGFIVDAETRDGEIENDMALHATPNGDLVTLNGTVGNGAARLYLRTSHADIGIHHGIIAPLPPPQLSPLPPLPPAAPPRMHPHSLPPARPSTPVTEG